MRNRPLLWFFSLAYVLSWAAWAPAVLARYGWIGPVPSRYWHLVGGLGPMLSAIVLTAVLGGRSALIALGRRCVAGRFWLVIAVMIPAGLFLLAAAILVVFQGGGLDWASVGRSTELPGLPRPAFWLANLVFYGFGEEVGWRGFALPCLQGRSSALRASALLAIGWAGWHLPLFAFSPGLSGMGAGGVAGWLVSLLLGSIVLTWLFNSTGGSIAAVALFHAALDVLMTSTVSPQLPNVMGALLTLGALFLIPILGRADLAKQPRVT